MSLHEVSNLGIIREGDFYKLIVNSPLGELNFNLNQDQLLSLRENIENILDPKRIFNSRLKKLKEFKRQAYKSYLDEKDPGVREQKLKLYLESKKLVADLEG